MKFSVSFLASRYLIFCVFYFWYSFFLFPYFTLFWISYIVLFTVWAVHVVWATFFTSFILWRSGVFFSVVPKSLAVVTSEQVGNVCFNFSYFISFFFYFSWGFGGIEAENLCIWIILSFFSMEILQASVTPCLWRLVFMSSRVQRESSDLFTTPFDEFREFLGKVLLRAERKFHRVLSFLSNSFWKSAMGVLVIMSSIIHCCCSCSVNISESFTCICWQSRLTIPQLPVYKSLISNGLFWNFLLVRVVQWTY